VRKITIEYLTIDTIIMQIIISEHIWLVSVHNVRVNVIICMGQICFFSVYIFDIPFLRSISASAVVMSLSYISDVPSFQSETRSIIVLSLRIEIMCVNII